MEKRTRQSENAMEKRTDYSIYLLMFVKRNDL